MTPRETAASIDEYIAGFPSEIQALLEEVRALCRDEAPGATETISYAIPTFDLKGRHLCHFAAFTRHLSFFPTDRGAQAFAEELAPYGGGKGTVQFPYGEPLPTDLIRRIVRYRVAQVEAGERQARGLKAGASHPALAVASARGGVESGPRTTDDRRESRMSDRWVVGNKGDLEAAPMAGADIEGVVKRVLVSPAQGWDGWVMRLFDVEPGGHTPRHSHDWPHINFVASGSGVLYLDGEEHALGPGSYAYVPANHEHQFRAAAEAPLSFVCIVPESGDS